MPSHERQNTENYESNFEIYPPLVDFTWVKLQDMARYDQRELILRFAEDEYKYYTLKDILLAEGRMEEIGFTSCILDLSHLTLLFYDETFPKVEPGPESILKLESIPLQESNRETIVFSKLEGIDNEAYDYALNSILEMTNRILGKLNRNTIPQG